MPDLPKERVLVTGASGFVGGRLVEAMYLTGSATPVAGIRQWSRAARPARLPIDVAAGDLRDSDYVERLVSGVDAIVHCAYTDDRDVILSTTRNLLSAAVKHGVRRFIYLSTAEVYGPSVSGNITETTPLTRSGSVYADAKIDAEQLCQLYAARGLPIIILRPSIVYGPFSSSWTVRAAQRLLSGDWAQFDEDGDGVANLVYVDDLVQAIFRALSCEQANGEAYHVNGPDRLTWNEYFARFNAALQLPPLERMSTSRSHLRSTVVGCVDQVTGVFRRHFEDQLMKIYLRGGVMGRFMKQVRDAIQNTPSRTELSRLYSRRAVYCDDQARTHLGYQPVVGIDDGLQLAVAWLQHHELAPQPDVDLPTSPDASRRTADVNPNSSAMSLDSHWLAT